MMKKHSIVRNACTCEVDTHHRFISTDGLHLDMHRSIA